MIRLETGLGKEECFLCLRGLACFWGLLFGGDLGVGLGNECADVGQWSGGLLSAVIFRICTCMRNDHQALCLIDMKR